MCVVAAWGSDCCDVGPASTASTAIEWPVSASTGFDCKVDLKLWILNFGSFSYSLVCAPTSSSGSEKAT